MTTIKRPDCWGFAMSFLGGPEDAEVERYVSALEAELERLRANDARYAWLKAHRTRERGDHGDLALRFDCNFEHYNDIDAAIDAAMKDTP